MYYCKDCGEFFVTPNSKCVSNLHGEVDSRQYEEFCEECCSLCGSSYYENAEECVVCGTITKSGVELCIDCAKDYEVMFTLIARVKEADYTKILDGAREFINKEG